MCSRKSSSIVHAPRMSVLGQQQLLLLYIYYSLPQLLLLRHFIPAPRPLPPVHTRPRGDQHPPAVPLRPPCCFKSSITTHTTTTTLDTTLLLLWSETISVSFTSVHTFPAFDIRFGPRTRFLRTIGQD